mmetsp:Transcript_84313/g.168811  ORF Transcript_84313/g.168811 Transcript_84313/m.168811 type:complete len:218 (-) Transcript_84313:439-1092(-)
MLFTVLPMLLLLLPLLYLSSSLPFPALLKSPLKFFALEFGRLPFLSPSELLLLLLLRPVLVTLAAPGKLFEMVPNKLPRLPDPLPRLGRLPPKRPNPSLALFVIAVVVVVSLAVVEVPNPTTWMGFADASEGETTSLAWSLVVLLPGVGGCSVVAGATIICSKTSRPRRSTFWHVDKSIEPATEGGEETTGGLLGAGTPCVFGAFVSVSVSSAASSL